MIPNQGWLPAPLNFEVIQYVLPEVYQVYYYVCNPGPYDPLQPWPYPEIEFITINQELRAESGWKNGAWGWVAGIEWKFAYGDALIDSVWPPDEPQGETEQCPGEVAGNDESCPPEFTPVADSRATIVIQADSRVTGGYQDEGAPRVNVTNDTRASINLIQDDSPA